VVVTVIVAVEVVTEAEVVDVVDMTTDTLVEEEEATLVGEVVEATKLC